MVLVVIDHGYRLCVLKAIKEEKNFLILSCPISVAGLLFRWALGKTWNGMEWNGLEWNGLEWNGMEFYSIMSS